MNHLNDKTYIITGGGSGTGKAVATLLSKKGATTIIWGRTEAKLQAVVEAGNASQFQVVDITQPTTIQQSFQDLKDNNIIADGVIHAAGIWTPGSLKELDPDTIASHVNIVTNGSTYLAKYALQFLNQESGKLILIAAASAKPGHQDTALNMLAKRAIDGLQEALHQETKDSNIKLTTFYPNSIADEGSDAVENGTAISYQDLAEVISYVLQAPNTTTIREILLTANQSI